MPIAAALRETDGHWRRQSPTRSRLPRHKRLDSVSKAGTLYIKRRESNSKGPLH
jgi:hypothetical protein